MTINEKILHFVDYMGISQRKFTATCGLSEGALRGSKSVGADKMIKIKYKNKIVEIKLTKNKKTIVLKPSLK